jgi:hypothetical protein
MKWLSIDSFQVSEDTPVRTLRGRTKAETKAARFMLEKALSDRRRDVQKVADRRIEETKQEVEAGSISEDEGKDYIDSIQKGVRANVKLLTSYLELGLTIANAPRAAASLSLDEQDEFSFQLIRQLIPDFSREKEYEMLTEGEGLDIQNKINKFTNMTQEERAGLGFLSDSPAPNSGNGLAKNAGSSSSTPKETATE